MPCADFARQRGAAIILALLTVMLAAAIAAATIASLGRSIDSSTGLQDQAQARRLARGAADWARNVLADDGMRTTVDHLGEPWAVNVPPTPVGDAEVAGEIRDWSGRFNVNNVAPAGRPDLAAAGQFERLLEALGVDNTRAETLTEALLGWISGNPDPAAGAERTRLAPATGLLAPLGPLADIGELRHLDGMDEALLLRLREVAVALPGPSKVNVNMAPAEVLFALTAGLDMNGARVLAAERERAWFRDLSDFTARLPNGASVAASGGLDVRSRHFLVTGRARHGVAVVNMEVLLDRKETWPEILWQRIP